MKSRVSIATMWPQILDCECGKSICDHPNLPSSKVPAIDIFCPFMQLKKLGLL